MALKFFLLALVTILSVQGLTEARHVPEAQKYGLIDEYQKLAEQLKQIIHDAVDDALAQIKASAEKVITEAILEIEVALEEIKSTIDILLTELKGIKEDAEKLGGSAKECIEQQKERIDALLAKTRDELLDCSKDAVAGVEQIYAEIEKAMNDANDRLLVLMDELEACEDLKCKGEVIVGIMNTAFDMNNAVRAAMAEALALIQSQGPEVVKCAQPVVASLKESAQAISQDIKECISGKIQY